MLISEKIQIITQNPARAIESSRLYESEKQKRCCVFTREKMEELKSQRSTAKYCKD